ncbi:hypothetical protein [Ascidiimonas sp. W6]|uniref:hypothetical protein n=1 Tax=Ascidiimonas meishanensis TaxID=3128903 RepID=UPI0030ECF35B
MNKRIVTPQLFFLLAIPIVLPVGFLSRNKVLDINFYDTYYLFTYSHFTLMISLLFGAIGFGYWILQKTNRKLSKWLSWLHFVLTFGGSLMVLVLSQFYSEDLMKYEFNNRLTIAITVLLLVIVLSQIIVPVQIIYGLTRKKVSK